MNILRPPVPIHLAPLVGLRKNAQIAKPEEALKPTAKAPARSCKTFSPTAFAHLRPAPAITSAAAPTSRVSDVDDFAMKMLSVHARARGEKFDRETFVNTPQPPPDRHVTGQAILRAVRKITGED